MTDKIKKSENSTSAFQQAVASKAQRKDDIKKNPQQPLWSNFSLFGIVGWSVSVPILLAIAIGLWLDKHTASSHSWTMALLPVGVILGCFNAWRWISHEDRQIHKHTEESDD